MTMFAYTYTQCNVSADYEKEYYILIKYKGFHASYTFFLWSIIMTARSQHIINVYVFTVSREIIFYDLTRIERV